MVIRRPAGIFPGGKVFHVPPPVVEARVVSPVTGNGVAAGGTAIATADAAGTAVGFVAAVAGAGEDPGFAFFANSPPFGVGLGLAATSWTFGISTGIACSTRTNSLAATSGPGVGPNPGMGTARAFEGAECSR